jgi:hypothetical protein
MMGKLKLKSNVAVIRQLLELINLWGYAGAQDEVGIDKRGDQIDKCSTVSEGHFGKWHRSKSPYSGNWSFPNAVFDRTQDQRQSLEKCVFLVIHHHLDFD